MVLELVDAGYAEGAELSDAPGDVVWRIECRDMRSSYQYTSRICRSEQELQALNHAGVVRTRIAAVDLRVHILDVYNEFIHTFHCDAQILFRHVQACLGSDVPFVSCQGTEFTNERGVQERFSATESDAASRGLKVEIVLPDKIDKLLRGHGSITAVRLPGEGVGAVTAAKRAAGTDDESCHAPAVYCHAQAGKAGKRKAQLFIHGGGWLLLSLDYALRYQRESAGA